MKVLGIAIAVAMATLVGAGPARAACPSNATQASLDIWPQESLHVGETVTGMHSCGRRIRCQAGNVRQGIRRSCRWL